MVKCSNVDEDGESKPIAENSPSLRDSNNGDHQSKSSSDGNDMNEVCELVTTATYTLRTWRIGVFVILFCTFSCILATIYTMINKEYQDDDEEAVSETINRIKLLTCHHNTGI
jgi:hypothetical protein